MRRVAMIAKRIYLGNWCVSPFLHSEFFVEMGIPCGLTCLVTTRLSDLYVREPVSDENDVRDLAWTLFNRAIDNHIDDRMGILSHALQRRFEFVEASFDAALGAK